MLQKMRIPEVGQRDRFIRRCVKDGVVFTLGAEDLASVPSQKYPGQTVQLFWSGATEARRWAEALSGVDDLQELTLKSFCADILPGLAAAKGLAGPDWVSDPIEAEIDPLDLKLRIQTAAMAGHLAEITERGKVFIIATDDGPAVETLARRGTEEHRLPVFGNLKDAEAWCATLEVGRTTVDPIADFVASTLPWAASRGHKIALMPISGAGFVEWAPDAVRAEIEKLRELAASDAEDR